MLGYYVATEYDIQTERLVGSIECGTSVPIELPAGTLWTEHLIHRLADLDILDELIKVEFNPAQTTIASGYLRVKPHCLHKLGLASIQLELPLERIAPTPNYKPKLRVV